jgi:hypothetical protein
VTLAFYGRPPVVDTVDVVGLQVATKYKGQFEKTVQAAAKTIVNEQTKNKDVSKDKKSELIRKQTSNAADEQASALSIFYNNAGTLPWSHRPIPLLASCSILCCVYSSR